MRQSTSYHREKEQVQQPIKQKKEEEVKVKAGLMSFFHRYAALHGCLSAIPCRQASAIPIWGTLKHSFVPTC